MGCHGRLDARARAKHAALAHEGLSATDLAGGGERDEALWRWYFQERLGKPVPADLAAYSKRFGFGDPGALLRAVLIERWYTASAER